MIQGEKPTRMEIFEYCYRIKEGLRFWVNLYEKAFEVKGKHGQFDIENSRGHARAILDHMDSRIERKT